MAAKSKQTPIKYQNDIKIYDSIDKSALTLQNPTNSRFLLPEMLPKWRQMVRTVGQKDFYYLSAIKAIKVPS